MWLEDLEARTLLSILTVTNPGDAGTGSLRGEIGLAQNGDTINFAPSLNGQTIGLTSGKLTLRKNLIIAGPGANLLTVNGNNASRVFDIQSGTVAISGLTITGGNASVSNGGGILIASTGSLVLDSDAISGNRVSGPGIDSGGGVSNNGTLTVTNSTFSGNQAGQGGAIDNAGTASITNSTINGNTASSSQVGAGGGINNTGSLTLENDTITENVANGLMGGVGGGVGSSTFYRATNTIIAQNRARTGPDVDPSPVGLSNLIGTDPKLGPLQNNGGPTPTRALLAGSPALNAGTAAGAPTADQRGVPRMGGINIGAYQASATVLQVAGFPSSVTAGTAGQVVVTALDPFGQPALGYTGTVHSSSSDPQAELPADYAFTTADKGAHSFSATLKTAGTQSLTATDTGTASLTGSQAGITVSPATLDHFGVSTSVDGSSAVAGTPFDVTVVAQDAFNNTVTGYTGTVHFSSADPFGATLPADYTFQATDQGVAVFPGGATLYTAGTGDITVADTASGLSGVDYITVTGAPAVAFQVVAPANAGVGSAFDVTVLAVDAYGNPDTDYTGTVHFTTTDCDPGVVLPADFTFQLTDAGVATFPGGVTLVTPGDQVLTVTDTVSGITGSATVTVGNTPPSPPPGGGGGAADGTPTARSFVPASSGTASPIRPMDTGQTAALDLVFQEMGQWPVHRATGNAWILDPVG
jgi:hypothetical protein